MAILSLSKRLALDKDGREGGLLGLGLNTDMITQLLDLAKETALPLTEIAVKLAKAEKRRQTHKS